jgi:hypothetical protein
VAIKGRGKARGRRVVAPPPRPTLVVRKPPIWQRRWVWGLLGALVVAGIVAGVLAKRHSSHARAFKQQERAAVASFTAAVERRLPSDRNVIPPDLVNLYPSLSTDLTNLAANKVKAVDALAEGKRVSTTATTAASGMADVTPAKFFPATFRVTGEPTLSGHGATATVSADATFVMSQGLRLYAQVGSLMQQVASISGSPRKALVQEAQALLSNATAVFEHGYQKLLRLRQAVGFSSINRGSGVQPGQPLPTTGSSPNPSASPRPSPSASP